MSEMPVPGTQLKTLHGAVQLHVVFPEVWMSYAALQNMRPTVQQLHTAFTPLL